MIVESGSEAGYNIVCVLEKIEVTFCMVVGWCKSEFDRPLFAVFHSFFYGKLLRVVPIG